MKKFWWLLLWLPAIAHGQLTQQEIARCAAEAKNVTIIRDNWGIPHIYGKTDADAVFGLMYAQCEDDFPRIEMNYLEKLGRLAEVKGSSEIYNDLLIRMTIDADDAKKDYEAAPVWLKDLCNAFADGMNYYLYTRPAVHPALLTRFEPWFPLLWTDGSIGAINTADITASDLKNLYPSDSLGVAIADRKWMPEETGSNGFAFAPNITANHDAILYINPHVTFYFRPEVQVSSEQGLNVYGAVTWGQFFVYQGFNDHCGWMHTSSYVDAADTYIEQLEQKGSSWVYRYENGERPVTIRKIIISYRDGDGKISKRVFNTMYTHHGPIMAKRQGQWLSVRADNRLMNGLIQCWERNKATNFQDFKKTLELLGNISNNTVYADGDGNIGYWHGNRIPKRDTAFDWTKPVDGTLRATEWKGYHSIDEIVQCINPPNGWLQNCNSTPFSVAGSNSPKRDHYPVYMAPDGENFRGINAVRVLSEGNNYTIDKVIAAGWDRRLSAFEVLIPALLNAWAAPGSKTSHPELEGPIGVLSNWDYRCGENSVATSLAVSFGEKVLRFVNRLASQDKASMDFVQKIQRFAALGKPTEFLDALSDAVNDLNRRYGKWNIAWGEINRFQRISPAIDNHFDDERPSLPDGFVSSTWGMLPSYSSSVFPNTKKRYGVHGNSFICAVEFGKKISAKALLAGGESGDPSSPHFFDQGLMYTKGQFRDVLFYKEDVLKHADRTYHPGE